MLNSFLLLVVGLVMLLVGAEILVRGASRLASAFGISALVVGLTVVAFGTSSPEIAVSVGSSLAGKTDLAVGNVVGSNIFNVLFILGLAAVIAPLTVARQLVRWDVPLMVGVTLLVFILALGGQLSRWECGLLVALLAAYIIFTVLQSRKEAPLEHPEVVQAPPAEEAVEEQQAPGRLGLNLLFVAGGLVLLTFGARWLVDGAVTIAQSLGLSDLIIGLTLISAGTSLPEVATSIVASLRGERDIAVGNVVGSNIFNLLAVLGISGLIAPDGLPVSEASLNFDFPIMLAVAFACLPIFFTGFRVDRWEGGLFLLFYVAFVAHLILDATTSLYLAGFREALLFYVIPLALVTLAVIGVREWRRFHRAPASSEAE